MQTLWDDVVAEGNLKCDFCAVCGTSSLRAKIMKCSGCKTVRYCSKHCQMSDWPRHKKVCKKVLEEKREREALAGRDMIKHFDAWESLNRMQLTFMVFDMLPTPETRREKVVGMVLQYFPEGNPHFKIVETSLYTLRFLEGRQDGLRSLYDGVIDHRQKIQALKTAKERRKYADTGYIYVVVRGSQFPTQLLTLCKDPEVLCSWSWHELQDIINTNVKR